MTKKQIREELKKAGVKPQELSGCCYLGFCGSERKRLAHLAAELETRK